MIIILLIVGFLLLCYIFSFILKKSKKGKDKKIDLFEELSYTYKDDFNLLEFIFKRVKPLYDCEDCSERLKQLYEIIDYLHFDIYSIICPQNVCKYTSKKYDSSNFSSWFRSIFVQEIDPSLFLNSLQEIVIFSKNYLMLKAYKSRFEQYSKELDDFENSYFPVEDDESLQKTAALTREIALIKLDSQIKLNPQIAGKDISLIDYVLLHSAVDNKDWEKIKRAAICYLLLRAKILSDFGSCKEVVLE